MKDMAARRSSTEKPGLPAKVAFLRQPASYPERPATVDVLETHMSWLFMTEQHVYKLKKPFHHDVIDYSTLAARRRCCRSELRLNRRLAPEVYLAVVPLTVDRAGCLALAGAGRSIDWLVKMRRLPADMTLEQRLRHGAFGARDARRIVQRLVPFFAAAPRAAWTPAAYRRHLTRSIRATARQLARPEFRLERPAIDAIAAGLLRAIELHAEQLDARVRGEHIVEGHGDLRPEHIYLTEPLSIVDCLEFDRELRLRDPIDELAFLTLECQRLGEPRSDRWFFDAYRKLSGDHPPRVLIDFHKARNAFVRAEIAIWHLDDPETGPPQHWIDQGNDYLRRARLAMRRLR
ncbi:MAG: hypothetical protein OQK79_07595 [Rhodanobacter sp.]|nr:hypothetical protein [Rhodanobacter sp.]